MEIDELGLDETDRNLLRALIHKFNGGPAGLDTLAATINEDVATIEDVYEPYLLQLGFIARLSLIHICYSARAFTFPRKPRERQTGRCV